MKNRLGSIALLATVFFLSAQTAQAAPKSITYRHNHHLVTLYPSNYPEWYGEEEAWTLHGEVITPLAQWRVDGDELPPLPEGVERTRVQGWNRNAIAKSLRERVAIKLNRDAGSVYIASTATGVVFDGLGMMGREVNIDQTVALTIRALEEDITDVVLPISETQPEVFVEDQELIDSGIVEVVTVGESNFAGSTINRRHNIATGLSKFDGTRIPKGSTFSFNEILGPVNGATGYRKELVILGDQTVPEYGGGLCQISTTAYRGIWEYGFPIEQRRNHSFSVQYYSPQGTDATIYPPVTDMKFVNDSPGDLLIQTYSEGGNAYYIFYGTRDNRSAEVIGPFTWDHRGVPPERIEYTTDLPPGVRKKVGSPVAGLKAAWYRVVDAPFTEGEESIEEYYSAYQARPLYYLVGVETAPAPTVEAPSWITSGSQSSASSSVRRSTRQRSSAPTTTGRPSRRSLRR